MIPVLVRAITSSKHESHIAKKPIGLVFKTGKIDHLAISEVLKITMHFPQVDNDEVRPSTRITDYDFTERVEQVNPDGSALFAVTLDSFKTKIILGSGRDKEEYFAFNSNNNEDLKNKLHDIRTLPRAQFLGQTLKFTVGTDGQVKHFENLAQFHQNSLGPDADYDFIHAMLSISDSLRMQQLFEHGYGAIVAAASSTGVSSSPSTATEIPIVRSMTASGVYPKRGGADSIVVMGKYSDAPAHIDYLEGLSANLGLSEFKGGGRGYAIVEDGEVVRTGYRDTSSMKLQVDIETVPEEIVRYVTAYRSPISVMHGGTVHLAPGREHRAVPKAPKLDIDSNTTVIDIK
jgi:hypothetical protein